MQITPYLLPPQPTFRSGVRTANKNEIHAVRLKYPPLATHGEGAYGCAFPIGLLAAAVNPLVRCIRWGCPWDASTIDISCCCSLPTVMLHRRAFLRHARLIQQYSGATYRNHSYCLQRPRSQRRRNMKSIRFEPTTHRLLDI